MLRDENATVLLFRDSALRRPIDVVAWMNTYTPREPESDTQDNVIPLARFSRALRRGGCHTSWNGSSPEGDAA